MKLRYRIYNIYHDEIKNRIDTLVRNFFPCSVVRGMVQFMLDNDKLFLPHYRGLNGVEIGVHVGTNAKMLLSILPITKLFLVDPYIEDNYYCNGFNYSGTKYGNGVIRQKIALEKLKPFGKKCVFISMSSEDAVSHIPNNLDFVYIDGNHSYTYVKRDIELYYSKVKKGGVLGGHDFSPVFLGVIKAVLEFIHTSDDLSLDDLHFDETLKSTDWWIVKLS